LDSPVERLAGNHVEGNIGITVVDPIGSGSTCDHGENDHPKTVYESSLEKRPAQADATNGTHRVAAFVLHLFYSFNRIPTD
jgi:hypothetical protein